MRRNMSKTELKFHNMGSEISKMNLSESQTRLFLDHLQLQAYHSRREYERELDRCDPHRVYLR